MGTFEYLSLSKPQKGLVIRYLLKISGYSQEPLTRLIDQYRQTEYVTCQQRTVQGFTRWVHGEGCWLTGRHGCPLRTADPISIGQVHNLRKSAGYWRKRRAVEKTQRTRSSIRERRPAAGQPGFLRIDTVHQGDCDKQKGVSPINAVDEVTQFQAVCTVENISEAYLIPALEQLLATFPFTMQGFHSDSGSGYSNGQVAALFGKFLIAVTASHLPVRPMITPPLKERIELWSGNSLALATFPNVGPRS